MPPKRQNEKCEEKSPRRVKRNKDGDQAAGNANDPDVAEKGKILKSFQSKEDGEQGSAKQKGPDGGKTCKAFANDEDGDIPLRRSLRIARQSQQHISLFNVFDKLQNRS